jgi:hypothetical protein
VLAVATVCEFNETGLFLVGIRWVPPGGTDRARGRNTLQSMHQRNTLYIRDGRVGGANQLSGVSKISVNLPDEVLRAARDLAEQSHVTLTEVLRRAISTQVFLEEAQKDGKSILLRNEKTREIERVYFR